MERRKVIQVDEKVPFKMLVPLSIQHMFAMFGASVLVPFIFQINPAIVLLMNGVGTLLFILITKDRCSPSSCCYGTRGSPHRSGAFRNGSQQCRASGGNSGT